MSNYALFCRTLLSRFCSARLFSSSPSSARRAATGTSGSPTLSCRTADLNQTAAERFELMETCPSRVTGFCFIGSLLWSGSGREDLGHEEVCETATCDLSARVENWGTARESRLEARRGSRCFGTLFIQTRVRFNRAAEDDLVLKRNYFVKQCMQNKIHFVNWKNVLQHCSYMM